MSVMMTWRRARADRVMTQEEVEEERLIKSFDDAIARPTTSFTIFFSCLCIQFAQLLVFGMAFKKYVFDEPKAVDDNPAVLFLIIINLVAIGEKHFLEVAFGVTDIASRL